MDKIIYLYNLTLSNYFENFDEPIFETILINYLSKNLNIIKNKNLVYYFITHLHLELDCLFYRYPKNDIKVAVKKIEEDYNIKSPRLISAVKMVSRKVYDTYLKISKDS